MDTHTFRLAIAAATFLATIEGVTPAQEAVPHVRNRPPGYDPMKLGDFEITAVFDGTVPQDFDRLMTGTTPEEVRALVARNHATLPLEVSINTFLARGRGATGPLRLAGRRGRRRAPRQALAVRGR